MTCGGLLCRGAKDGATERRDLEATLAALPEAEAFVQRLLARFRPYVALEPGATVMDLGAAQGLTSAAYMRAGFRACGVEPWVPAIEVSQRLGEHLGLRFDIREGVGEHLPFDDESIDLIHAYSVMEHVDDPHQVFREAHRVLRPGGAFYFMTANVLSPRQNEIAGFPMFPWYPPRLQRQIMLWAAEKRPSLVGYTPRPAMHWFHQRATRLALNAIGFGQVVDKWRMRSGSGELGGVRQLVVRAAAANPVVRLAGDVALGTTEFLAVK